jgi:hypothetical protein
VRACVRAERCDVELQKLAESHEARYAAAAKKDAARSAKAKGKGGGGGGAKAASATHSRDKWTAAAAAELGTLVSEQLEPAREMGARLLRERQLLAERWVAQMDALAQLMVAGLGQ